MMRTAKLLLPAVVAVSAVALPAPAWAATSCTFTGGVLTVTAALGEVVTVVRSGTAIIVTGATCAGSPSTTTVDQITANGQGTLVMDLAGGQFEPGISAESTGASEIEFATQYGTPVTVRGGDGRDELTRSSCAVDLNLDGDTDLTPVGATFTMDGGAGDDTVSDLGGDGCSAASVLFGGTGDDRVTGSPVTTSLDGGDGADHVIQGRVLTYYGTSALVYGGPGNDMVSDCGAGRSSTPNLPVAVPNGGQTVVPVPTGSTMSSFDLRVSISSSTSADLVLQLSRGGDTITLADALVGGTDVTRLIFDDESTTPVSAATAPFTGRYRPVQPLAGLLDNPGEITLTVRDLGAWPGSASLLAVDEDALMHAMPAADTHDGGLGVDTIDYSCRSDQVVVLLDGGPSGEQNDQDTSSGFESARTGSGDDYVVGTSDSNRIDLGTGLMDAADALGGDDQVIARSPGVYVALGEDDDTFTHTGQSGPGGDTFYVSPGPGDDVATTTLTTGYRVIDLSAQTAGVVASLQTGTSTSAQGTDSFTGFSGLIGTNAADQLTGDDEDNVLTPLAGADIVSAGGGDDLLVANAGTDGADDYSGGPGNDTMDYTARSASTTVRVDGFANDGGEAEGDRVQVDIETVNTGSGDDEVTTHVSTRLVSTGVGSDTVHTAHPLDVNGGDDVDTLDLAAAVTGFTVDLGMSYLSDGVTPGTATDIENVIGTAFADTLVGTGGPNSFTPGSGNDAVFGGEGNDMFVTGAAADGADSFVGGTATDTVDASARTGGGIVIALDGIANDGAPGEGDNFATDIENAYGGSGADRITGTNAANVILGGAGDDALGGRGGDDTLDGGTGNDLVGGHTGNDSLSGGSTGNDRLVGGDGNDTLEGLSGADSLTAGPGDDDVDGGADNDRILEGDTAAQSGSDLLRGGSGVDVVSYLGRTGGVRVDIDGAFDDGATDEGDNVAADVESLEGSNAADVLTGSPGTNSLKGFGGNDVLTGLAGIDALDGGTGDDRFAEGAVASGKDSFVGGTGSDTVDYRSRTTALRVDLDNVADDGATGEGDNARSDVEVVQGGSGADVLTGNSAANKLYGFSGNDVITGAGGADYLHGGAANDTFYARDAVKDTVVGDTGTDKAQRDAVDAVSAVESYF